MKPEYKHAVIEKLLENIDTNLAKKVPELSNLVYTHINRDELRRLLPSINDLSLGLLGLSIVFAKQAKLNKEAFIALATEVYDHLEEESTDGPEPRGEPS